MKKAIVTGAGGFVGSHLVKELRGNNVEVIAVVKNEYEKHELVSFIDEGSVVCCDMSDVMQLRERIGEDDFDVFYHFAWAGTSGDARSDADLQMQNVLWTINSLKAAKELGCKKYIFAGSIMEKDMMADIFQRNGDPGVPNIYGIAKLIAHGYSKAIAAQMGIEHICGVITNAYGEGEISPRFLNSTVRRILNGQPLQFTAATQNYDFVYVTDVAYAFYLLGQSGKSFCEYIIGSGEARPLRQFIEEMVQTLSPELKPEFGAIKSVGIDTPIEVFDISRLVQDTGFEVRVSFEQGVRRTMEWIKARGVQR